MRTWRDADPESKCAAIHVFMEAAHRFGKPDLVRTVLPPSSTLQDAKRHFEQAHGDDGKLHGYRVLDEKGFVMDERVQALPLSQLSNSCQVHVVLKAKRGAVGRCTDKASDGVGWAKDKASEGVEWAKDKVRSVRSPE